MGLEAFTNGDVALGGVRAEAYRRARDRGDSHDVAYAKAAMVKEPERDPMVAMAGIVRRFPDMKP